MATAAFPIRELSADVQFEAAYAQKAFWSVADGVQRGQFHLRLWYKTQQLNGSMDRLIEGQQRLIACLQNADMAQFTLDDFGKQASDLERLVAMTTAFVDAASEMPEKCVSVRRPKLETISELAGHLDNFAESFRIASNQECTAALAKVARGVMAREVVPAH